MRKFDKGDVVLCKKFSIEHRLSFNTNGLRIEPYIDDYWFNRKAYISHTYKEYMDKTLGDINEDKDEYELRFLDDEPFVRWAHWIAQAKRNVSCIGAECPVCNAIKASKQV